MCLYCDHGLQNIKRCKESGAASGPQELGAGCPWTLTSSLTFHVFTERGLISTLFPRSHTGRCEAGPGGKRVALSRHEQRVLQLCASASPGEGPTSCGH